MSSVAAVALVAMAACLAALAAYLGVLTFAALRGGRSRMAPGPGARRFAILVPAHNEELLIGRLIQNLDALDYPRDRYDVFVVADNCDDDTAERARTRGAHVYERFDRSQRGKGFALRWLLRQIRATGRGYDAYVVFDADSVVQANFLRSMDGRLAGGAQVIQAYYSVLNATESMLSGLRFAALAAVHYLRPLGRSSLGLSSGLKGNGMCFAAPVIERFSWRWFGLAEDVEFHLALVGDGLRVEFAPETTVLADMPVTFAQAESQNARWEQGRLQQVRERVPALLREGVRRRDPLRIDAAVEQLIPPLSVSFALAWLCLGASWMLGVPVAGWLAAASLAGHMVHLCAALLLVRAPLSAYRALAYTPLYVGWKLYVYGRAMAGAVGARNAAWIRTARTARSAT